MARAMGKSSLQGVVEDLYQLKTQFGELQGTVSELTQQMRSIFDLLSNHFHNSGTPRTSMSESDNIVPTDFTGPILFHTTPSQFQDPKSKVDAAAAAAAASCLEEEEVEADQTIKKETHPSEDLFSGFSNASQDNTLSPQQTTIQVVSRNKKKNQRKTLRRQRQAALTKPGCSHFYMFVFDYYPVHYALYRMDIAHLNNNNQHSSDNVKPLVPLLTFGPNHLPPNCTLVHLGDHLYFVGEAASHVFMIAKHDIKNLRPDENRPPSDHLLKVGPPMKGPKVSPHVFVAKGNLYVFSRALTYSEMYCPSTCEWTVLESKPYGVGDLISHFVLDDKVYFGTECDTSVVEYVLSFNLTGHPPRWNIVSTSAPDETFNELRPAFRSPVLLIGDMLFGRDHQHIVAASPYSSCNGATESSFMRPTLAASLDLLSHLHRRFDILELGPYLFSDYYTALQTKSGQNVLCCITYGPSHSRDAAYAHFTFYKIPGGWCPEPFKTKYQLFAVQKEQSGCMLHNQFKSEFMHEKLFKMSTTKFSTCGTAITCFFY